MKQFVSFTRALLAAFSPGKAHHTRNTFAASVPLASLAFVLSLTILSALALAPKAEAQVNFDDVIDVDWEENGFTGFPSGGPQVTFTGGSGLYRLPIGWDVQCTGVSGGGTIGDFDTFFMGVLQQSFQVDFANGLFQLDIVNTANNSVLHVAFGTPGTNDVIVVPGGVDVALVFGFDGDDEISSSSTTPMVVFGGGDDDEIDGTDSTDFLYGDWVEGGTAATGTDIIRGGASGDWIEGGPGDDTIDGEDEPDFISGGPGVNALSGGFGEDGIFGGNDRDEIDGGDDGDFLFGADGDDLIIGRGGVDIMIGGAGRDDMFGGDGEDLMEGGTGDDFMRGEGEDDDMFGGDGNDCMDGGSGVDSLDGEDGTNFVHDDDGTPGDTLEGGAGNNGAGLDDNLIFSLDSFADTIVRTAGSGNRLWRDITSPTDSVTGTGATQFDSDDPTNLPNSSFFTAPTGGLDPFESYAMNVFWTATWAGVRT